jgi:hypothetical protein
MSVTLRAYDPSDDAWLSSWAPGVAASVGYDADGLTSDEVEARIIERDKRPVGVLVFRRHAPSGDAAMIEFVGVQPADARAGSGMRAAAMIEDELRGEGVQRLFAAAPAAHGIAMYFWIRLGYRPLLRGAWPCVRDGVAWLERRIDTT